MGSQTPQSSGTASSGSSVGTVNNTGIGGGFFGSNPSAGFGGVNGQSMQNQQVNSPFQPPIQQFQPQAMPQFQQIGPPNFDDMRNFWQDMRQQYRQARPMPMQSMRPQPQQQPEWVQGHAQQMYDALNTDQSQQFKVHPWMLE